MVKRKKKSPVELQSPGPALKKDNWTINSFCMSLSIL